MVLVCGCEWVLQPIGCARRVLKWDTINLNILCILSCLVSLLFFIAMIVSLVKEISQFWLNSGSSWYLLTQSFLIAWDVKSLEYEVRAVREAGCPWSPVGSRQQLAFSQGSQFTHYFSVCVRERLQSEINFPFGLLRILFLMLKFPVSSLATFPPSEWLK